MEGVTFTLEKFEGPLDLLLSLIAKHKLDIYDIPISRLLEQYLDYIEKMQAQDMDVASEFLEMAARLVYIKTAMLLPRHEEEAQELKSELEGQLLEYSVCKQVAQELRENHVGGDLFVRAPEEPDLPKTFTGQVEVQKLLEAYLAVAGRRQRRLPPPETAFHQIVARKVVSIRSRVTLILSRILGAEPVPMSEIWQQNHDRYELVASFLAVLELIRHERICVTEDGQSLFYNTAGGDIDWESENIEEQ
mgnify:FL=1